jgi:hypothetical protein
VNHRTRIAPALVSLLVAPALGGCAIDVEEEFATATVTSALESSRKQGAGREVVDAVSEGCPLTAAEAVQEAASRPQVGLFPEGCVQKTPDGDALHVEFNGCTGVFGRVELQGGVDASVELTDACLLHADIVDSGDLTANGKLFDYHATADVEVLEGARQVDWNTSWSGETRRGRDIQQTAQWDVWVDHASSCRDVAGHAEGQVGRYPYDITIEQMSICPDACPSDGVVQAHWKGRFRERNIRIEFDGSNYAHVVGWSGREFDVEMVCGADE